MGRSRAAQDMRQQGKPLRVSNVMYQLEAGKNVLCKFNGKHESHQTHQNQPNLAT